MSNSVIVLQHVQHEGLGTVARAFEHRNITCKTVQLFERTPECISFEGVGGLVMLGGPMNVDQVDEYPFLKQEIAWIQEAVARKLPVLGICLGSQLLAKALGAIVFPNRVKEIGWYEIELTEEAAADRLFGNCKRRQTVFQWHGDTFELPSGAVQLARSSGCEHQAFRYGKNAYGLQFHIEVTPEMVCEWLNESNNRSVLAKLEYVDPDAIRTVTPAAIARMRGFGDEVVSSFTTMCSASM